MTDKKAVKKSGARVAETGKVATNAATALKENLRQLLPALINADGKLDVKALRDLLTPADTTSNNQGYELTFAGKGWARYEATSETKKELSVDSKQSKNFAETRNIIIRGDNLDALKILYANYHERVKMIYIDPPYNKENENFIYKNDFRQTDKELIEEAGLGDDTIEFLHNIFGTRTHSGWLTFMYPRLKLARELLREDGLIFISIDDNESANLKIICDEIFGEKNFLFNLAIVNNLNGNDNRSGLMETQEGCLVYCKNKTTVEFGLLSVDEEEEFTKWKKDELGYWKEGANLKASGENAARMKRPNLYYPVYIDENSLDLSLECTDKHTYKLLPKAEDGEEMSWTWKRETLMKDKSEVIVKKVNGGYSLYKRQRPALGDLPSKRGKTTFYKPAYSNTHGNKVIRDLFGRRKIFNYPKSVFLIQDFVELSGAKGDDIILDFFAGSGTTGDAVMRLNAKDGGKRRFILVQWDEEVDKKEHAEAYKFCKDLNIEPVISSICIERLNRAGDRVRTNNGEISFLDIGYKVFCLTDKPSVMEEGLSMQIHNPRKTAQDVLFNMLAVREKPLDTPIKTIVDGVLYEADGEAFLLADISPEQLEKYRNTAINLDGWAEISLDQYLNLGVGSGADNIFVIY